MDQIDLEHEFNETLRAINARLEYALSKRGMGDFDESAWKVIIELSSRLPAPQARHKMAAMGLCPKAER